MQRNIDAKVSPEAMQTILLDEIASRLGDIHTELISQTPRGNLYSQPMSVDIIGESINLFYAATIYNDGADDIYILKDVNRGISSGDVPLKKGENIIIDMKRQTNKMIWLKTMTGTASVRVFILE